VQAKATVVATGGGGHMYRVHSNARSNTGEGYSWALEAGAELVDMEMIQFHPTGMAYPPEKLGTLITEKVRGNGGILKNKLGERFMARYQPELMELAGRDEVARAIYEEIQEGRGTEHNAVYLDTTHWEEGQVEKLIPDVFAAHMEVGIDIRKQMMETTPTMHHMMGGFVINEWGETTVDGLYAVGEVTASVHGANRLGGNSLGEGQVFGRRCGLRAAEYSKNSQIGLIGRTAVDQEIARVEDVLHRKGGVQAKEILGRIKDVMWDKVGMIRDAVRLESALKELSAIRADSQSLCAKDGEEQQACLEIHDMLNSAEMIAVCALERKESRGAHYRTDYPKRESAWEKNIRIFKNEDGKLITKVVPLTKEVAVAGADLVS